MDNTGIILLGMIPMAPCEKLGDCVDISINNHGHMPPWVPGNH